MKQFTLATLACLVFCLNSFSQTTDSVLSENKVNGVWQKSTLDISKLDASCNLISHLQLAWDESNQTWINSFLTTSTTDETGDSKALQQSWDALNSKWVNYSRTNFVYSSDKSKFTYTYQMWDAGSNTWVNNYRIIQGFDDQGRGTLNEFDSYFDNAWQRVQRGLYSYGANGYVSESKFQFWTNNEWLNNTKTTYDYTGNGVTKSFLWDNGNHVWTKFTRTFNQYLSDTPLAEKALGQVIQGDWVNSYRNKSTYDDNDRLLTSFQQSWDAGTSSWTNSFKSSHDYFPDGDEFHSLFESWDATSNSWLYGFRSTSSDLNCNPSLQLIPVDDMKNTTGILVQNKKSSYFVYRMPSSKTSANGIIQKTFNPFSSDANHIVYDLTYNSNGKQYAYELILSTAKSGSISNNVTSNATITNRDFVISPNPARNYFNINVSAYKNAGNISLKISDISGKLVMQKKVEPEIQRVDISSLQKGMYIVTIASSKEVQSKKLVVE